MKLLSFFAELKRRNVYKVAVAYAVAAWLLIQLASILFPTFDAPPWVMKVFIALVAFGFPIALIFAWAFELTPEGIKRSEDVSPNESTTRRTGRKLVAGIALAAVIAAGLLAFQLLRPVSSKTAGTENAASAAIPDNSIAVLPFVNMSGDPANEYFSDGITEEILNAISHLPNLRVAARTSAFAYKGRNEDIAAIARNLRVTNVLEGSVQRMGERIRVTAQLIDASSGFHLWSNRFDREAKDLFAVQDEIAQAIAGALKLKLERAPEQSARSGTENVQSHDAYLKALEAHQQNDLPQALALIDRAIALDPKFAAAYARKAQILSGLAFGSASRAASEQYVAQGELAAKRAVELDGGLAEAHAALGEIARRRGDVAKAVEYFERATKLKPADPELWQGLGLTLSPRDPAAGLRHLRHAKELGGTSLYLDRQIAFALDGLGQAEQAHAVVGELHAAHPEFIPAYVDLGRYEMWVLGRLDRALPFFVEAYRKAPAFVDATVPISAYPALIFALSGDLERAERWLARASATAPESDAVTATQLFVVAARGDRAQMSAFAEQLSRGASSSQQRFLAADLAILTGDFTTAAKLFRELIDSSSMKADEKKPIRYTRHQLKLAYALLKLGQKEEAAALLKEIGTGLASVPRFWLGGWSYFYQTGQGVFYTDAELYAVAGEKEKSLAALKAALALPDDGLVPVGSLPVPIEDSPLLESLRGTPGFEEFREEVARRRGVMKQRVQLVSEQLGLADD